jgi:hypothetical protein
MAILCSCGSIKVVSIASPRVERLSYKPEYHFNGYDVNHCLILASNAYCSGKLEFASQNDWLYDNSYMTNTTYVNPFYYTHSNIKSNTKDFVYNCAINFTLTFRL